MTRSMGLSIPGHARKAWRTLLAAAGQTLGRRATLMRHEAALFPRFVAHYAQLARLPRRAQRRLLRRARLSLAGLAFLCATGQAPAFTDTIIVGGTCTLADAIVAANTDAPSGGCAAGFGANTIVLPHNSMFVFSEPFESSGDSALPSITSPLTIEGNGSTLARPSGAAPFRILTIFSDGGQSFFDVTLNDLTIQGGAASVGGGILVRGAAGFNYQYLNLTLNRSRVTGNQAVDGGGIAIVETGAVEATVTMNDSALTENSATNGGGFAGSTITIQHSTVSGNSASESGGGVRAQRHFDVEHSTISGNSARGGGGISSSGHGSVRNSTISGNTAEAGAGVLVEGSAAVNLADSTITANTASIRGGGWLSRSFSAVRLARTIVSGNSAPIGREMFQERQYYYGIAEIIANDFNLIGHSGDPGVSLDGAPLSPGGTDIVPSGPPSSILGPLGNNGGPTMTHALVADSPALDVVPSSSCAAATDQRGVVRPQGLACDIGAFEREPSPPGFAFNGFFAPVSNDALNSVKAGQGIPVRFSLGGDKGLNIFEGGYPATQQVACDLSGGTSQVSETTNAGNSSLSYDAVTDTYTFVWKTDKGWSNSCRRLLLRFAEGSTADAEFRFTK